MVLSFHSRATASGRKSEAVMIIETKEGKSCSAFIASERKNGNAVKIRGERYDSFNIDTVMMNDSRCSEVGSYQVFIR